jgi:DNA-binding beta-propeller fold protein YncE
MIRLFRYICFSLAIVVFSSLQLINAQTSSYKIIDSVMIGGGHRWDYLTVDTSMNRLYVTHSSEVNVIDIKDDSLIATIPNLHGLHGVALAYNYGKGFISNGENNSVTVFDLKTLKVLDDVEVNGKGPDAIIYDPYTHRVFTFNGKSDNSTAIDAKTNKVVGSIQLDGRPEFAVSDNAGRIYVNLENKDSVEVFNPESLTKITRWALNPGTGPSGLAIDVEHGILFAGCHNQMMVIVNTKTGKVIDHLPIGKGVDACRYDAGTEDAFSSTWDGNITVIKEEAPDKFSVLDIVQTEKGARTMGLNIKTHKLYTVTMLSGGKEFGVLVLDRK